MNRGEDWDLLTRERTLGVEIWGRGAVIHFGVWTTVKFQLGRGGDGMDGEG